MSLFFWISQVFLQVALIVVIIVLAAFVAYFGEGHATVDYFKPLVPLYQFFTTNMRTSFFLIPFKAFYSGIGERGIGPKGKRRSSVVVWDNKKGEWWDSNVVGSAVWDVTAITNYYT